MNRIALICCVIGVLWVSRAIQVRSATADWQYTKWGMGEAEVVAASNGKTAAPTAQEAKDWHIENYSVRLKAPYSAGKFGFTAVFYFDGNGTLAMVNLKLHDTSLAHDLVGELRAKYGNEVDGGKSAVTEFYVWRTDTDQINLLLIGIGAIITFTQQRS